MKKGKAMKDVLITIISVSYNCKKDVEKTIESLKTQTYKNFEYLVIDGKSKDGTVEEIEKHRKCFKYMTIFSEPDKGIYDAMNKGVSKASGKYIFFLNFCDCFCNENVLNDMVQKMKSNADIYYGDIEKNGIITVQKNKATIFNCVYREYMICHQSIFAKREVLCRYPFDIQYRLCADRDWLTKILKNNYTVEYVNKAICKYDITGQSSDPQKFMEESKKVSIKYGGEKAKIFIKVKRYFGKVKKLLLGWF